MATTRRKQNLSTMRKRFCVCEEGAGRLDRFLKKNIPVHYGALMRAVRCGDVKVNGKRGRVDTVVGVGDSVDIYGISFEQDAPQHVTEKDAKFVKSLCIYQDDHLWVCQKPPGLAVQRGTATRRSLDVLVRGVSAQKGDTPWRLVHRIDKRTSGVVVCAKNRKTAQELTELFRTQQVTKDYLALVEGRMYGEGVLQSPVGPQKDAACTRYRVVASARHHTLLRVQPITGRKRQIRQHLSSINHPIVGDGRDKKGPFLALHALSLSFVWCGQRFMWMAPVPEAFRSFARSSGLHF